MPHEATREAVTVRTMALDVSQLPDDIATLKAMLVAATATLTDRDAEIANLKLTIAKMQRDRFGSTSERGSKLLDQLELQLAELEASVAQDKSETAIQSPDVGLSEEAHKPARRPLPDHLPRERHVHDAPEACQKCSSNRLRKLGEGHHRNARIRAGALESHPARA